MDSTMLQEPDFSLEQTSIDNLRDRVGAEVTLRGWLYNKRSSKGIHFIILRDGTGLAQCVVNENDVDADSWRAAEDATQESALELTGLVREDERQVGGFELQVTRLRRVSGADDYPITPKEHGIEFLMNHRHLWLRSRRPWAVMRIRNRIIMSIHQFFQERGFIQMDAPILTGNAVEGTSTLFELEYFGEKAYLTQSGQLHGEAMAMAFGKIYTFGPTFRAEKSKTRRHLTEFWMIEPEMAYYDLGMNMDLAEAFLCRIASDVLEHCGDELEVLGRDLAPLQAIRAPFPRISYSEAVELLRSDETADMITARIDSLTSEQDGLQQELTENRAQYGQAKKHVKRRIDAREIEINQRLAEIEEALRNLPAWKESARNFEWGNDLGGSDETVITWHFDRPIIVHRYPAAVKAFYMKRDPSDDRLALGMDILAPEGYGEVIGGGERATDLAFLERQVAEHGLPPEVFDWYFDLRRYGSVPHAGFGLGLERTVSWMCGLQHIRETIPFPRLMGRLHP
jgi:asparaginyl-tRNA synthetase